MIRNVIIHKLCHIMLQYKQNSNVNIDEKSGQNTGRNVIPEVANTLKPNRRKTLVKPQALID